VIGHEFPYPIDLTHATPRDGAAEGQNALDYCDAASPLLYKQHKLLGILNDCRRERHQELRNEGKTQREFDIGDLVIVRRQVQSRATDGVSAKLTFRAKGPYRVLEKVNPGSYRIQKLPFLQGLGRPGRVHKESAARMEKISSTLVLHKHTDGADTCLASMVQPSCTPCY